MLDKENINYKDIVNGIKPELQKVISFMERETSKIRTSRATPSLVEDVVVDCFGQKFPLKQLSAISTPEARQILIQPWDKSYTEGIVAALEKTGIGANPVVDKDAVRLTLPPLTQEYRKNLFSLLAEKKEQSRQTVRRWRDEAWDEIQERFKEGKIREDDKFRGKEELQKLVDEYNKKIEELTERKHKEILE
ncbi:MAG: ribosome recycling factor [Parcubacteria group bacterium Gr01-1014_30]|nr:MAG: ribosome recycling factor [Parcubacteria group bacterium Gr01-1014_30]